MTCDSKIRFVLVGGFLGAGKTTLIGELARRYMAAGKRVGIITNDQAADLVDTQNLRSQGFQVGEVAGACFCCSFNDLVSTADRLIDQQAPDVLLAEPVGSCTDLVATVVLPLQQMLGDRFELAPFGVLLKPSHGLKVLAGRGGNGRGGFSPQAEYIFHKQLEEADYLMIGRADELNAEEIDALKERLSDFTSGIPIIAVSPRRGDGVDQVLGYLESPMAAGRRLLEIDYDTYAQGEAELGWVNLSANLATNLSGNGNTIDLDRLAKELVGTIAESIRESKGQIAHLKVSVAGGDAQAVANVVSNESPVDVGLAANRSILGPIQVILNARVAMDPQLLEDHCRKGLDLVVGRHSLRIDAVTAHSLRPGRPVPTHRVQSTV